MRGRAVVVVVALALLGAPACSRGGGGDDAFRLHLDGRATVERDGHARTVADGGHTVAAGDVIRMRAGTGVLELPGDRSVRLRATDRDASVVNVADAPEIVDGDAVVVAGSDGVRFSAGDVEVDLAGGAVRVHRGLSVTVAVYRGKAQVRTAGRGLAGGLAALRQVSIAATGQVPRDPSPLVYDDKHPDPWDREFLGDAIDLGHDLDQRSRGLTGQLGPRAHVDATLLQRVLPPLTKEPVPIERIAGSSAGEAVVGAAIAVEAASKKDLTTAWDEVFDFRADGAKWGLVALDQQVKRAALKARLDDAAGRSPLLFAAGPRRGSGGTGTTTNEPSRGGGSAGGSGRGTTTTTPPPQTSPTTVPTPIGPITVPPAVPLPPGGGSDPSSPTDVITGLVNDLLGPTTTTTTLPPTTTTTPTTAPPLIDLGGLLP
jgi:hypothetical protein